jgi:hypothetical protein
VVTGSLLVYKNAQFSLRAREGEDYTQWFLANTPGATHDAIRYGDCIETCSAGEITGDVRMMHGVSTGACRCINRLPVCTGCNARTPLPPTLCDLAG